VFVAADTAFDTMAQSLDELKKLGNDAFAAGKYSDAIEFYSQGLVLDPQNHVLFSNRSAAFLARNYMGDAYAALADATACVRIQPSFSKGYNRKAQALMLLRQYEDAIGTLTSGLRADPTSDAMRDLLTKAQSALSEERMALVRKQEQQAALEAQRLEEEAKKVDPLDDFMNELSSLEAEGHAAKLMKEQQAKQALEEKSRKRARARDTTDRDYDEDMDYSSDDDAGNEGDEDGGNGTQAENGTGHDGDGENEGAGENDGTSAIPTGPLVALVRRARLVTLTPMQQAEQSATLASSDLGSGPAQIERIRGKHFKWLNLNPFEVLQLPHTATEEDMKMRYRRLSALVHPDKNAADDRANEAFQDVKKAFDLLMDRNRREVYISTVEDAMRAARRARRKLLRDGTMRKEQLPPIDEDYVKQVRKAFAELEQRKRNFEVRMKAEAKREIEEEMEAAEHAKAEAVSEREWATGRERRADGWKQFVSKQSTDVEGAAGLHLKRCVTLRRKENGHRPTERLGCR
jgi:DnaJ family protein C protein 8